MPAALFTRYLRVLGIPLMLGAVTLVGFNAVVDPFGLTRLVSIRGFNQIKILASEHRRLIKAYRIRQVRPGGIILGTSQADAGLDPDHPGWPAYARPVFNAGLPYANAYEIRRYFQHAVACGHLREAVIGLDLVSFNAYLKNQSDFSEARLAVDAGGRWVRPPLDERVALLMSWDATRKSLATMRGQPAEGESGPGANIGYRGRFLLTEAEYMNYMWRHGPQRTFSLRDQATGYSGFDEFRLMLRLARENHIRVRMFFSPVHARLLEALRGLGWWPVFEDWKRTLCQITAESNAQHAAEPAFELWDFSDYNSLTMESVPPLGDTKTAMTGYADSAHYTGVLGNLVLDRLFDFRRPGVEVPEDFGVRLSAENLESHLASVQERARAYRASHPADAADIGALAVLKPGDAMSRELDRLGAETGRP